MHHLDVGQAGRYSTEALQGEQSVRRVTPTHFVPPDFVVPTEVTFGDLRLVPLGPEHNAADYAAWTSSIDHIRATPGFPDGSWPMLMPVSENLRDLERHAEDFRLRRGFTYTVLDANGEVIGCVYIYPSTTNTLTRKSFRGFAPTEAIWIDRSTKPSELGYAAIGPSERSSTTSVLRSSAAEGRLRSMASRSPSDANCYAGRYPLAWRVTPRGRESR